MHRNFFGLIWLLLAAFPVVAGEWDEAVAAYGAQRYDDVVNLLAPMASPRNVGVQLLLFDTYIKGRAELPDDAAKFEWTRRAAELGVAPAQEQLAQDYLHGIAVPADEVRAAEWFRLAADQWYPPAIYNLAVMTLNGQGVSADLDYAMGLLHRAADLNEPYALYVLGGMYLEGRYVWPDESRGIRYLAQAAFFGQRRAMALLGVLIAERQTDPDRLVKSAFHFRRALAAGCTDLDQWAAEAINRLSPEEVEWLEYNLAAWQKDMEPHDMDLPPGPCLTE